MLAKDRLQKAISDSGLNLKDFSVRSGVNYRTLQHYIAGERKIGTKFLAQISEQMGISASWVLAGIGEQMLIGGRAGMEDTEDFIQIKRYTVEASAGHGAQVSCTDGTGYYAFNQRWLDRRGLNANSLSVISVRGDSMEPDLYENDLLLLDHAQTDLKDSHIYAVQFSDGLYVKRIQHLPEGQIHLISRNTNYPPITVKHPVADGVQIIGRVVASMHEW
ncbi:MAG: transcriptional regulator [Marinosulfonomonas sp.]|nr:MAG: transcriptional regulator [Marinosulfonomonas sp.]